MLKSDDTPNRNNTSLCSSNDPNKGFIKSQWYFCSVDPISKGFQKDYVHFNKTTTKYPKPKRSQSSLTVRSNLSSVKSKRTSSVHFSRADRLDIHLKAMKYLDALFESQRKGFSYREPHYKSKTNRSFISSNEIITRIMKETEHCPMLSSKKDQISCFGSEDLRDLGIKKFQEHIERSKYSTVSMSLCCANQTSRLPDQKEIKKEMINQYDLKRMRFGRRNESEREKKKSRYRLISNNMMPKEFEVKKECCAKIKEHQMIAKRLNESIMGNRSLFACLREKQRMMLNE